MEIPLGTATYAEQASILARKPRLDLTDQNVSPDGTVFTEIGIGSSRIALLGPDNIVYKAQHHYCDYEQCSAMTQMQEEVSLFNYLASRGCKWVPDFWYYSQANVIAMPRYRREKGIESHLGITAPEILAEIGIYTFDYGDHNFGLREDGSVVLLDGGRRTDQAKGWISPGALVS